MRVRGHRNCSHIARSQIMKPHACNGSLYLLSLYYPITANTHHIITLSRSLLIQYTLSFDDMDARGATMSSEAKLLETPCDSW